MIYFMNYKIYFLRTARNDAILTFGVSSVLLQYAKLSCDSVAPGVRDTFSQFVLYLSQFAFHVDQLSVSETAAKLGVEKNTVSTHRRNACEKIRKEISFFSL